ncbi:MAG: ATP-binding protein [Pseudomonadota bacterium]
MTHNGDIRRVDSESFPILCGIKAAERVICSLPENTIKYGYRAWVELLKERDVVIVRIDNEGLGVSAEMLATVFEPFQLPADDSEGSGLGLVTVRTIAIDRGGSDIRVNRPEGGLRVE